MTVLLARDGLDHPLRLTLFAGLQLSCKGRVLELAGAASRVLAFLALHDRPVSRSFVAGNLWMDVPEDRAIGNLRTTLWRMPPEAKPAVSMTGTLLSLSSDVWVDVRAAGAVARRIIGRDPHETAGGVSLVGPLLALELLPDWDDEWVTVERERLRHLRLHALEALCQSLTAEGRFGEAVEVAMAAITAEPLRESAHRTLIGTHLAEGNYAEALAHFRAFERLLDEEMQLNPSPEMLTLVRDLLPPVRAVPRREPDDRGAPPRDWATRVQSA